jgi:hypothetical protein
VEPADTNVLNFFEELGRYVQQTWTTRGHRTIALSEVAADALRCIPMPEEVTPSRVLSLLALGTHLPKQRSSSDTFGQPPVLMYKAPNFEIQAIVWMEGSTSVHQHGFDGAFKLAAGSSLHVRYTFDRSETIADGHLVAGNLAIADSEVLRCGDVRTIQSGPDFIHALFHFDRPSMTIVVRNGSSDLPFPQYDYRLPGLGFDALYTDDRLRMRCRGLHSLYRLDRDGAAREALNIVLSQELWTAFRICDEWALTYGSSVELSKIIEALGSRSMVLSDLLAPMYAEEVRRGRLMARRGMLHESRHRLFLALVVNLPDRDSISRALAELFPNQDPALLIMDIVRELASPKYRGISGLNLREGDLNAMELRIRDNVVGNPLRDVAERWNPPSLLGSLFA